MFVRFDCGCVGVRAYGKGFVIRSCDAEQNPVGFFYRSSLDDKDFVPLEEMEALDLICKLDQLAIAGQDMERVAKIFKRYGGGE